MNINDILQNIQQSVSCLAPELLLSGGILVLILYGLIKKDNKNAPIVAMQIMVGAVIALLLIQDTTTPRLLFGGALQKDSFSTALKLLMNIATLLAGFIMIQGNRLTNKTELSTLFLAVLLGGHLLVMSNNFLLQFLTFETISISSYVLAASANDRKSSEASLKYFLFGSAASAVMLYGFSILYGITGTLDFTSRDFIETASKANESAMIVGSMMIIAGLLFKVSAAPLHFWAPDVYEGAPIPVIAFFSVVPKLAGLGILTKFVLVINLASPAYEWQTIMAVVAILTMTFGNFAALAQNNVKRLMAYSSIAQSGFLLVGLTAFLPQGIQFMIFYAAVYTIMNFVLFIYLEFFDKKGLANVADFSGTGKHSPVALFFMLVGLIALTGLPPTAGFTGKLFLFSSLWESYQLTGKNILLWLLIFGLLNTVVSLFYYLKIPYYAFLKDRQFVEKQNFLTPANLLGLILVLALVALFFLPGLLMGWINKVNFVL